MVESGDSDAVAGMLECVLPLDQHNHKIWLSPQKTVTAITAELLFPRVAHAYGSWVLPPPTSPQVLCLEPWGCCSTQVGGDLGGSGWDLSLISFLPCAVTSVSPAQHCLGRPGSPQLGTIQTLQLWPGMWWQDRASSKQVPWCGIWVRKHIVDDGKLEQSGEFSGINPLTCSLFYGLQSSYK